MRARVVRWLRACAAWVEGDAAAMRVLYVPVDAVLQRAAVLCDEQADRDVSGESKRHQVYARLLKEFPTRNRRAIALAIEAAL